MSYSHPRSFGFSTWKKTAPTKQDTIDVDEKRETLKKNPDYDWYSKDKYDLKEIIKNLPRSTYIAYIAYVKADDAVKYRQGGFLVSNKDDRFFALSNRQQQNDAGALGISFSVQYANLYDIFVKKDKKKKRSKKQKDASPSPPPTPRTPTPPPPPPSKPKRIKEKKYHIYLDGDIYKSFEDTHKRTQHLSTQKFHAFSQNKKIELG